MSLMQGQLTDLAIIDRQYDAAMQGGALRPLHSSLGKL
jgi:hypothetical protein